MQATEVLHKLSSSGNSGNFLLLKQNEIWEMYQQNYGYRYQEATWNWMRWKHYTVRLNSGLVREYCNWETFKAQCNKPGEVILMTGDSVNFIVKVEWNMEDVSWRAWTWHEEAPWNRMFRKYYQVRLSLFRFLREYYSWVMTKARYRTMRFGGRGDHETYRYWP